MLTEAVSFNNRKTLLITSVITGMIILAAYIAGLLIPAALTEPDFSSVNLAPSADHLFGTDWLGRDLFFRTVKGLSVSITVGIIASAASAVIALIVGVAAAYGSKAADSIITFMIDLVMGIPHTVLIILISFAVGRGMKGLVLGIIATHWTSLARLIRAEVMQLRSSAYVEISRALGKNGLWIFKNHFLPHLIPQFLVGMILLFPHAIMHEASITFLGFGLPPEQPAIGIILSESMRYLSAGMWWLALCPGALLTAIVLLFDRLGNGLKVLFDPYRVQL